MKRSKYIDHTLLKADAQEGEIIRLCDEAKQHDFASVCVYSYWARTCAEQLKGTGIKVCCVAGFPSGAMSTAAKAFEAADAIRSGADEIDMVMNIGELKAGHADAVRRDIEAVVQACAGHPVKVILETCLLSSHVWRPYGCGRMISAPTASAQAADRSLPRKRESSFPPLGLLLPTRPAAQPLGSRGGPIPISAEVFRGHGTSGGPAGQAGTAQRLSRLTG